MFKNFNKTNISLARIKAEKALAELGKEMGCTITLGRIGYDDFQFKAKLIVKVNSPEANAKSDIPSFVPIGKTITISGIQFKISGYNPRSYKKPVQLTRVKDGKGFKTSLMAAGISRTW